MTTSEKRKYIRVSVPLDITCIIMDADSKRSIEVIGKDLSLGGIKVIMKEPLAVGTLLTIMIKVSFALEPITIEGKVIWQNYNVRSNEYDTGIGFVKADQENKIRISEIMIAAVNEILQQLDKMLTEEGLK